MKLIRFGEAGQEKPGIIQGERRLDVSASLRDYDEAIYAEDGIKQIQATSAASPATGWPVVPPAPRSGRPLPGHPALCASALITATMRAKPARRFPGAHYFP